MPTHAPVICACSSGRCNRTLLSSISLCKLLSCALESLIDNNQLVRRSASDIESHGCAHTACHTCRQWGSAESWCVWCRQCPWQPGTALAATPSTACETCGEQHQDHLVVAPTCMLCLGFRLADCVRHSPVFAIQSRYLSLIRSSAHAASSSWKDSITLVDDSLC